jgi:hypothetical protein
VNHSRKKWLLVVLGTLLWVLAIYPAYYVVHKPLTATQFHALANVVADLLTWVAMMAVAVALGSRLTRRLNYSSLLERIVFSAGIGLGFFSVSSLALCLVGAVYRWLFWVLLAAGGLLLWRELRDLAGALRHARRPVPQSGWSRLLTLFIAATLLLTLVVCLLPPTAWDSLTYHLVGPERYLKAHRMTFELYNYYLFFPSFTEMLFLAGMALKGDVIPRLIHFSYLLLTLAALAAFARRHWEGRYALPAVALFLSIPTAVTIASWAYVDLAVTFYTFGAVHALLNWLRSVGDSSEQDPAAPPGMGWLVVAGLMAGAAASVKYTGASALLALGVLLLWSFIRRRLPVHRFWRAALLVLALALLVALPWYAKNALVTGNPFYPLIWGGKGWNHISSQWLLVLGQEKSVLDLLLVPWTLTVIGTQGTQAFDSTVSPLFLALLPLLLVVRRKAHSIGQLLLVSAVGFAAWIASGVVSYGSFVLQGRFLLPVFAPLSLLCSYSLEGMHTWDRKALSIHRFARMLVGLTLAFVLLSQILQTTRLNPSSYLAGHLSRSDYLNQHTTQRFHQAATFINQNLTSADKVFFFWEPRSYGIHVAHRADPLFDNYAQLLARHGSPGEIVAGLQREGFTHLLVNLYIYPWMVADYPLSPEEQMQWQQFQARYLRDDLLVHAEPEFLYLYRLPTSLEP